jgi:hypothetical protein
MHNIVEKSKGLISFDDSNFTKNCGIHNLPFSSNNFLNYECNNPECKETKEYLNILKESLATIVKSYFVIENGKLIIWNG